MAKLLSRSDADELGEIIERWLAEASTAQQRLIYERFAAQLLDLKQALAETGEQPSQQQLEFTLTMMLELAAQAPPIR